MLRRDKKFFLFLIERAARFRLLALPAAEANPANIFLTRRSLQFGDSIYRLAFMVVWIFVTLHFIVLYPSVEEYIQKWGAEAYQGICRPIHC